jgi:hypothetical protein
MSNTRRNFLQSTAGLAAAGLSGARSPLVASTGASFPPEKIQVPKMDFFGTQISRMVLGVNQMYGFAHFNKILGTVMAEWYTTEKVCEVMHRCNQFGINAFNYVHTERAPQDLARFTSEGGKMHLIIQVTAGVDETLLVKTLKPLALQRQGEIVDKLYHNGEMNTVKEWCKKVRDLGTLVGVGTHIPEVIEFIEEKGWDVDFYSGCVYNRLRTPDEWRKVLNGELMEMPGDTYMQSDPPRMYKVIRQTKKPCFAFKILAAGRINEKGIEQAFRTAFESIKPTDAIYVGMFPRVKDEVKENAGIVHRILSRA